MKTHASFKWPVIESTTSMKSADPYYHKLKSDLIQIHKLCESERHRKLFFLLIYAQAKFFLTSPHFNFFFEVWTASTWLDMKISARVYTIYPWEWVSASKKEILCGKSRNKYEFHNNLKYNPLCQVVGA